jgi:hypothetical protein
MKKLIILLYWVFISNIIFGQTSKTPHQTQIMTLGVFHFAYHNLDAVITEKKDQISVLEEPYHSEIISICRSIENFKPTIIAIEQTPNNQNKIDSLYSLFKSGKYTLGKDEIDQLAFRIGKKLNLPKIHCVNDWGRHYMNIKAIFKDSIRSAKIENYYFHCPDSIYESCKKSKKVTNIIEELEELNNPKRLKERLSGYLLNPFKYEEKPGDFTGVDFETGRWFNRNLRIFRNIQRIACNPFQFPGQLLYKIQLYRSVQQIQYVFRYLYFQ